MSPEDYDARLDRIERKLDLLLDSRDEELLTVSEAAPELGVSEHAVRKWIASGRSPKFARVGSAIRFRRGDIREFIASRTQKPSSGTEPDFQHMNGGKR